MTIEAVISQVLSGLSVGMVLFLIAAGLSIIFGTLRILNMAHGSIYMLAGFICFTLSSALSMMAGAFWWALLLAPIVIAVFGGLIEFILLRRIYNQEHIYQYILTFALVLVIGDACKFLFGAMYQTVPPPWPFNGIIKMGEVTLPTYNFFLMACGIILFAAISALMRYTTLGRTVRAVTHNRDTASTLGINVPRVYTGVFMLGCYFAGLAGSLMTPLTCVTLGMDISVIIECFIIVVIGGLGSVTGAFIGAIILGLVNSLGILIVPQLALAFPFLLMIIILIIRPWGLLGKPE